MRHYMQYLAFQLTTISSTLAKQDAFSVQYEHSFVSYPQEAI